MTSGNGDEAVDVDVAVVGAGPAGAMAALTMARRGLSVALVERGGVVGEKNLSGGVLYCHALADLPEFFAQAPFERRITRHVTTLLQPTSTVSLDYDDSTLAVPDPARPEVPNAVSVLRARLDPWLAAQAEAAGAFLMPGMRVSELATEPGGTPGPDGAARPRIRGIVADGQVMRARVVVAADGVNSFLARAAGVRPPLASNETAVGIKAVLGLDPQRLEDRFGVGEGEGAAHALVGDATLGLPGGAFLYTNSDSLSVGVVVRLDALAASGRSASDLFEHLLGHPGLRRYLSDTTLLEYGSHLVAEGGWAGVGPAHRLVADGLVVVGDAAGLTLNSGLVLRGMDLALISGRLAGEAVADAVEAGDPSAAALTPYYERLAASIVGADLRTARGMPDLLARSGPYGPWGATAEHVLRSEFMLDGAARRPLRSLVRDGLRSQGVRSWLGDLIAGWRSL